MATVTGYQIVGVKVNKHLLFKKVFTEQKEFREKMVKMHDTSQVTEESVFHHLENLDLEDEFMQEVVTDMMSCMDSVSLGSLVFHQITHEIDGENDSYAVGMLLSRSQDDDYNSRGNIDFKDQAEVSITDYIAQIKQLEEKATAAIKEAFPKHDFKENSVRVLKAASHCHCEECH